MCPACDRRYAAEPDERAWSPLLPELRSLFGHATRRCFRDFLTARLAATDSEVADHVRGLDDDEMEQLYRAVCEQQELNNWFVK